MKGNVLRKRNSISPLSEKSWKKGEKERLPTTSRDGTDPEREVFLSPFCLTYGIIDLLFNLSDFITRKKDIIKKR